MPRATGLEGFAFHAVDDPVDDHFVFELGEDAEHLDEHAPGRGGGVERFGRRPEDHSGLIQTMNSVGAGAATATSRWLRPGPNPHP